MGGDRRQHQAHGRTVAGLAGVPVAWFDGSDLEATAYAIADNRRAEFVEWDDQPLAAPDGDTARRTRRSVAQPAPSVFVLRERGVRGGSEALAENAEWLLARRERKLDPMTGDGIMTA